MLTRQRKKDSPKKPSGKPLKLASIAEEARARAERLDEIREQTYQLASDAWCNEDSALLVSLMDIVFQLEASAWFLREEIAGALEEK